METFSNLSDGMNNPLLRELASLYPLWLDDLGSGGSTLNAVTANIFEYIKLISISSGSTTTYLPDIDQQH